MNINKNNSITNDKAFPKCLTINLPNLPCIKSLNSSLFFIIFYFYSL